VINHQGLKFKAKIDGRVRTSGFELAVLAVVHLAPSGAPGVQVHNHQGLQFKTKWRLWRRVINHQGLTFKANIDGRVRPSGFELAVLAVVHLAPPGAPGC
jgi:hypothetical protein